MIRCTFWRRLHSVASVAAVETSEIPTFPSTRQTNHAYYFQKLASCKDLKKLLRIHGSLVVLGINQDDSTLTRLINAYASFGECNSAALVFNYVEFPSAMMYNSMIRAYTRSDKCHEALKLYHKMLDRGTKPDKYTYTFVLKACTGTLNFEEGINIHKQIVREGLERDVFISSGLIGMYHKMGQPESAREVFDQMRDRDVVVWNAMIAGLSQSVNPVESHETFRSMQFYGVKPNSVSLLNLFPAVCKLMDIKSCRAIHAFVIRRDFRTAVYNGLIDMYCKCGYVDVAHHMFDLMRSTDDISWATLMAGYTHNGYFEEVLELFDEIRTENRKLNKVSAVSSAMAASELEDLRKGIEIHNYLTEQRVDSDVMVATALMTMYARCGKLGKAKELFGGLKERDLVAWSALIAVVVQAGYPEEAISLFREMSHKQLKPNVVTLLCILPACAEVSSLKLGKSIHCYSLKGGIDCEDSTGSALVSMYAKCGQFSLALTLFDRIPCKDVVTWNALVNSYTQIGRASDAMEMFFRLRSRGMKPDEGTVVGVISACALSHAVTQGTCLHGLIVKCGFQSHSYVKNALIDMYAKFGRLLLAELLFNDTDFVKDEVSWNAMISGHVQNGSPEKAFSVFSSMMSGGMPPNVVSVVSILPGVADLTGLREGMAVHSYTVRMGFQSNTLVGNSLIDMYAKCGQFEYAEKYFDEMENKNTISWNAMISGYAAHGKGMHAIALFSHMRNNNVMADSVSFLSVLSACRHAGLIEEARKIFHSMRDKYCVEPGLEHYAIMVDLFGRSGLLGEIMGLIDEMPMEPNEVVWGALLGACRMHCNVDLAEIALENLVKLEPGNPAHYVGLSSIYAQSGRWVDSGNTLSKSKDTGLGKIPGCTWI